MYSDRRESRKTHVVLEIKNVILKFLVIGDYGVGKTAIVRRYTEGKFTTKYKTTIGADFASKIILREPQTRVSVQLWDIAGNERYKFMSRAYYKYAVGCIIVFDVTRHSTLVSVKKWLQDLREKVFFDDGSNIPVVLLANKWDTEQHIVATADILEFCKENNILKWFQTSAKNNINIGKAILCLVDAALEYTKPIERPIPDLIQIEQVEKRENGQCCRYI